MPIALSVSEYGIIVIDDGGNLLWTWEFPDRERDLRMYGLDVHPETGNFFVTAFNEIMEISRTGKIVWKFTSRETYGLHSLQLLPNGHILTSCALYDRVLEIDKKEGVVWRWDAADHYPPPPGHEDRMKATYHELHGYRWTHLNHAERLPDGDTLIGMYYCPDPILPSKLPYREQSDGCIVLVDPEGCIKWEWGRGITQHQHFVKPYEDGYIVVDSGHCRLLKFKPGYKAVWEYKGSYSDKPLGIDVVSDRNIVTFPEKRKVLVKARDDTTMLYYSLPDSIPGRPHTPKYLPEWVVNYTPEERKIIEERLRKLGYIE